MQRTRRRLRLAVPALLMVFVATTARAQSASNDLLDLDIEQLMEVQIIPIDVLGKHIHPKGEWIGVACLLEGLQLERLANSFVRDLVGQTQDHRTRR